jgi:hypothetical protein
MRIGKYLEGGCYGIFIPNIAVKWISSLHSIRKNESSALGPETDYPTEVFVTFSVPRLKFRDPCYCRSLPCLSNSLFFCGLLYNALSHIMQHQWQDEWWRRQICVTSDPTCSMTLCSPAEVHRRSYETSMNLCWIDGVTFKKTLLSIKQCAVHLIPNIQFLWSIYIDVYISYCNTANSSIFSIAVYWSHLLSVFVTVTSNIVCYQL